MNNDIHEEILIDEIGPFRFAKPLSFRIERTSEGVIIGNEEVDLIVYGRSMEDALLDLLSEIEMAWEEYALGDDSVMDDVARDYKKWLLENVEKLD